MQADLTGFPLGHLISLIADIRQGATIDKASPAVLAIERWRDKQLVKPALPAQATKPIAAFMHCPRCQAMHVDRGEWASRPHHTHLCAFCTYEWRVEPYCYGVLWVDLPSEGQQTVALALAELAQRRPGWMEHIHSLAVELGFEKTYETLRSGAQTATDVEHRAIDAAQKECARLRIRASDADRLADEVDVLIKKKVIDSRSPAADALLDFRDPPRTERSSRLASMEQTIANVQSYLTNATRDGELLWSHLRTLLEQDGYEVPEHEDERIPTYEQLVAERAQAVTDPAAFTASLFRIDDDRGPAYIWTVTREDAIRVRAQQRGMTVSEYEYTHSPLEITVLEAEVDRPKVGKQLDLTGCYPVRIDDATDADDGTQTLRITVLDPAQPVKFTEQDNADSIDTDAPTPDTPLYRAVQALIERADRYRNKHPNETRVRLVRAVLDYREERISRGRLLDLATEYGVDFHELFALANTRSEA
jgi:hypothetical protein